MLWFRDCQALFRSSNRFHLVSISWHWPLMNENLLYLWKREIDWSAYHLNVGLSLKYRVLQGHILCNVRFCLWLSLLWGTLLVLSVFKSIGWHSVQFVCFLQWHLRAGSPMNKFLCFFHILYWDLHSHLLYRCSIRITDMGKTWYEDLVDHSVCFHTLLTFGGGRGNIMSVATVCSYPSLNFVSVFAVFPSHSGIHLSLFQIPISHQRYLDPRKTVLELFVYRNDTYIN